MDEPLPAYSPSLHVAFLAQVQFESSTQRWTPYCLEINSTQLLLRPLIHSHDESLVNRWYSKLHEVEQRQGQPLSQRQLQDSTVTSATHQRDGIVLRTAKGFYLEQQKSRNLVQWDLDPVKKYSLHGCRIGLNTQLTRCLRVKCEQDQFLLRVPDEASVTLLFAKIACAAELAVPLDIKSHDPLPLKLLAWESVA
ncbi:unnamed protein product [Kluyveromyces dobzhanskii CBS 2104]|uniref:WGS project CCBQ000000000 data, contig 00107 n=1 Tax=Kluyveromyces dobzhanskii CBS 2104 TaxID=1427455 RepID=A0A0A8L113_9SACH|nr:unnamed protein product [Kluyveromyces dobzhanskii CBS 2104]